MTLFLLPVGLILPTVCGWLLVRMVEYRTPVLASLERWVYGCVWGLTLTMFVSFLLNVTAGMPFTLLAFASVQVVLTIVLTLIFWRLKLETPVPAVLISSARPRTWVLVLLSILSIWTCAKLAAGFGFLVQAPPYYDDTYNNWNMRGKAFFVDKTLTLIIGSFDDGSERDPGGGTSSYPPTVPLTKTWLATLAGHWNEPLVASVHFVWFLGALSLVYFTLRRVMSWPWALLGVYVLSSLPLYLMHGSSAYADAFMSVHIFAVLAPLFLALRAETSEARSTYFRIMALGFAALAFTKNEAIVLHLPFIMGITAVFLFLLTKNGVMSKRECTRSALWMIGILLLVAIPWLSFKWYHGLAFGNAKALPRLADLAWQEGALRAIYVNTFHEGNWLLLFHMFPALLLVQWRRAFLSPLAVFVWFFLFVYVSQLLLFLFTGLSTEAIRQTGYARGLIQMAPAVVVVVMVLLHALLSRSKEDNT